MSAGKPQILSHSDNPTNRRHAVVAFIVARAEAEKALRGKPDRCIVDRATFAAMLNASNRMDATVKADPETPVVFRGVTLEVSDAPGRKDSWQFQFISERAPGKALPHDPVAAAKWRRDRKRSA